MNKIVGYGAFALAMAACAGCAVAADEAKTALKLEIPRPLFQGTPVPIALKNLEKPRPAGTKRPDFMVPEGTALLSKGKAVTSSDDFPVIGDLSMVTDGDKSGVDGAFVELGRSTQYVQIDLEKDANLYAIVVWFYHLQARVYHDVIVQISSDKDFINNVTTVYNNDDDNSSGKGVGKELAWVEVNEGRIIDAKGTKGRYVRIYSKGNTSNEMNHYVEVEVYGKPAS